MTHTPGPWESSGGLIGKYIEGRHSYTHIASIMEADKKSLPQLEAEANENLIRSAPELLDDLKIMVKEFGNEFANGYAANVAKRAIAKAEGRS